MKAVTLPRLFTYLHYLFVAVLGAITLAYLNNDLLFPYAILTILVLLQLGISSNELFKPSRSRFLYLFGLLVSLGCWFKYSIYAIIPGTNFPEPIGKFVLGSPEEADILWVSSIGIAGIFCALLINQYIEPLKNYCKEEHSETSKIAAIILLSLTIFTAVINLKYNILLFALKPDIQLPFKGNVLFFLFLTRALPFLFLFYCLRKFSLTYITLGAFMITAASVGVLSRMGILIYFFVIFFLVVRELPKWSLKSALKNISVLAFIFAATAYVNVSLSTGAREFFFAQEKTTQTTEPPQEVSINTIIETSRDSDNLKTLKSLALGRWIGIEGIMAVNSYPEKGFRLLNEALAEKLYDGNSFYTTISSKNPVIQNTSKVVVTSVPGPIAFLYYSNSYLLIFFGLLATSMFYIFIERTLSKLFPNHLAASVFIIVVLSLDFYQFGISPIAFTKYLGFTLFSVIFFYFIQRKFPSIK
ncbi:MAG: hypothetical protein CME71_12850 [Halobacteriovorax sp.]|nr:hypothetical protein [Halobacteriovorax sp.]